MKRVKKTSMSVPFVKKDEEMFDGDQITITNEGQVQEGQFGDQFVVKIKLANAEERAFTINQTTENNLIDAYGDDSINWVGKKVNVFMEKKKINGKRVIVAYLAAPGWEQDEFGDFVKSSGETKPVKERPASEEPVPFPEDDDLI